MLEAVLYLPVVLCFSIALIYLAVFNMQEYFLMYETQKVNSVVTREAEYIGYSKLPMGQGGVVTDFEELPSDFSGYYGAYGNGIGDLYREVSALFHLGRDTSVKTDIEKVTEEIGPASIIAVGNIESPKVKVKQGLLGSEVTVSIVHHIPVPGILKYLGYEKNTDINTTAYSYAVNPSDFVRKVDMAVDFTDYMAEKLELDGEFDEFRGETEAVLDKILGTGQEAGTGSESVSSGRIIVVDSEQSILDNYHNNAASVERPTWQQSEDDAEKDFPDYDPQQSFINGKECRYGDKGSVRPDLYNYEEKKSIDVKNYDITTPSGRSSLARNIEKQYKQRVKNLPAGAKQAVLIDIRGQNVSQEELIDLYKKITEKTNGEVEIMIKVS